MNKAAFTEWFSKEFPLFSVKIVERRVLGTNLIQVEYGIIPSIFVGFTKASLKMGYTSPIATNKGF